MTSVGELVLDFRSDTLTQPVPAMKEAMAGAELGDDVYGEDPTTLALQDAVARLTGFEAALFFPTGSMGNLAALLSHAEPGRALFAGACSHIKMYELGSYARIAGLNLIEIDDSHGYLELEVLRRSWCPDLYYMPRPGLVTVENTHNILGGKIYPEAMLARLRQFTQGKDTPLHMDGARILNAARASGRPVRDWTRHVDSVMISLSKGLGAPVGSVLAGSDALIGKALRMRKLLGGGMRQTGMLAAAGHYALNHHLPLLDRDHERCRRVYEHLRDLSWLRATQPETNILILETEAPVAAALREALAARGVKLLALSERKIRIVFHLHISDQACDQLATLIRGWDGQP